MVSRAGPASSRGSWIHSPDQLAGRDRDDSPLVVDQRRGACVLLALPAELQGEGLGAVEVPSPDVVDVVADHAAAPVRADAR